MSAAACLAGALAAAAVQEPEAQPGLEPGRPIQGLVRALWRPERAELWLLCRVDGSETLRVFDPWLREREAPILPMPEGGAAARDDGSLRMPAWAGHDLVATAKGELSLSRRAWETRPRVTWGPGWAAVEVRSTVPLRSVPWRRAGDAEIHLAAVTGESLDGILQRAHLRGLAAGETIEIALPPTRWTFPEPPPRWVSFAVPAVDPAGPRPTSEWPSD